MHRLLSTRLWLAPTLLAAMSLMAGALLAHEGREVGNYRISVGWVEEPAYEGALNAVEVRVSRVVAADSGNEEGHGEDMAGENSQESHAYMGRNAVEAESAMSVSITLVPAATGGADLNVETEGFAFAPEKANQPQVSGQGHAHVFVNGAEAGMIYSPHFHLGRMADGMNEVRVVLNTNSHENYTRKGELVEAMATIHIAEGQGGGGYGEPSASTGEAHDLEPVEDLQETLQVEVAHTASGESRVLNFQADLAEPGRYTADLIPTAPGVYEFRVFGAVEGSRIDELFVSEGGGGDFDDIQTSTALQFPQQMAGTREIESAVRGAIETAQQAQDAALEADGGGAGLVLGIVGSALGAAGLVAGVVALFLVSRTRIAERRG